MLNRLKMKDIFFRKLVDSLDFLRTVRQRLKFPVICTRIWNVVGVAEHTKCLNFISINLTSSVESYLKLVKSNDISKIFNKILCYHKNFLCTMYKTELNYMSRQIQVSRSQSNVTWKDPTTIGFIYNYKLLYWVDLKMNSINVSRG